MDRDHNPRASATDGTGTQVQGQCRPFQESSGSTGLSPGSLRGGKQTRAERDFRTWGILGVPQLIKRVSHHRQISSTCSGGWFLTILGAFQCGGSKPELVVGDGSQCDGGVFSTAGYCLRSTRSIPMLRHIKDRTSGSLPPRWKTSGLA